MYPNFSNIVDWVKNEFNKRKDNPQYVSSLNSWIRVSSGVGNGLILQSNTNTKLLKATGDNTSAMYGDRQTSGILGTDWNGGVVQSGTLGLKPSPVVTSFEVDEGAGSISRKATLNITAFTRQQADELSKYFLEPGFSIFVEWGWNQPDAFIGYTSTLRAENIVKFQEFKNLNEKRKNTKGLYDNFLGFITGGKISVKDDTWEINVECTGYPELPAYLMIADTTDKIEIIEKEEITEETAFTYGPDTSSATSLGFKRFKMMFNELPTNKRSKDLRNSLLEIESLKNPINYINFDDTIREAFNRKTDGEWKWFRSEAVQEGDEEIDLPPGTKLIGEEKFIKFSALMDIISTIGANSYKIGDKIINFRINTEDAIISAFPQIFSTDKSKLFIPNARTPKFSLKSASEGKSSDASNDVSDNSVRYGNDIVYFPYKTPIQDGIVIAGTKDGKQIQYKNEDAKVIPISKDGFRWGFLDDLYVNFDFVKGIIETNNFLLKDALYQILNGISSAAGSIWDFQIEESPKSDDNGIAELRIIDKNFVSQDKNPFDGVHEFDLIGENSIFIDNNFDISISSNMMNQIIGQRLGQSLNSSSPSVGKLFAEGLSDKILTAVNDSREVVSNSTTDTVEENNDDIELERVKERLEELHDEEDTKTKRAGYLGYISAYYKDGVEIVDENTKKEISDLKKRKRELEKKLQINEREETKKLEEQKERFFKNFLGSVGVYPKVEIPNDSSITNNISQDCYIGILDEKAAFERAKLKWQTEYDKEKDNISVLLPVTFTFTVHGISGIKRGDKFKVKGLPFKYSNNGFFQVTSIKHSIDGMTWKTEIEGGFRTVNSSGG